MAQAQEKRPIHFFPCNKVRCTTADARKKEEAFSFVSCQCQSTNPPSVQGRKKGDREVGRGGWLHAYLAASESVSARLFRFRRFLFEPIVAFYELLVPLVLTHWLRERRSERRE